MHALVWLIEDTWQATVAEAAAFLPRVEIFVGGTEVNQLPPFNWGFISAVRYDFR